MNKHLIGSNSTKNSVDARVAPTLTLLPTLSLLPTLLLLPMLLMGMILGCERSDLQPGSMSEAEQERMLAEVAKELRAAASTEAPEPKIDLTPPEGWTQGEIASLPPADIGFTVPYRHGSGISVTLYQFTRGLPKIVNDANSGPVQDEMHRAKVGIQQAVQIGMWESAIEKESRIVPLGESPQQALWSQHHLKAEGVDLVSDTYVWAMHNTLFKIRCTGLLEEAENIQETLKPLLTKLGSSE